jgi:hypothetical protein
MQVMILRNRVGHVLNIEVLSNKSLATLFDRLVALEQRLMGMESIHFCCLLSVSCNPESFPSSGAVFKHMRHYIYFVLAPRRSRCTSQVT